MAMPTSRCAAADSLWYVTVRRLLFSARLSFPVPLQQMEISVPAGDGMRVYPILPAELPLHPRPIIEHTFEPPPHKVASRDFLPGSPAVTRPPVVHNK